MVQASLDVSNLTALVFQEQCGTGGVGDDLGLVRQAVNNFAVFNGLDQSRRGGLPLGTACARIGTGHLPLGNSHGKLFSLDNSQACAHE